MSEQTEAAVVPAQTGRLEISSIDQDKLTPHEVFWRDHYHWLLEHGYQLRPRYHPEWIPSWKTNNKRRRQCEDSMLPRSPLMDAKRVSDGAYVMLKRTSKAQSPFEVEIGGLFSKDPLLANPKNHCIPIFEALTVPDVEDRTLLVMPMLRPFDNPAFDTVGEGVEFLQQIIDGVQFMHANHVAHRDIARSNIMMDANPLISEPYHPIKIDLKRDLSAKIKPLTRTQKPVKYFLIDFGLSRRYSSDNLAPRELPNRGADKTVPEFQGDGYDTPQNPYFTDIYYLGNFMRMNFTTKEAIYNGNVGFDFLAPLVKDMVQDDPTKRPTIDEVSARFEEIRKGLSAWKLRSHVTRRKEIFIFNIGQSLSHWSRRIGYIVNRVPAVPSFETKRAEDPLTEPPPENQDVAAPERASQLAQS